MARPKRQVEETVVSQPLTEQVPAPVTYTPPPPRQMRVEREGDSSVPFTRRFPQVRGGTCEFCGVMDKNMPSQYQYRLCPHYRGMSLRCSYCPDNKDPDEVVYKEVLNIAEHPDKPGTLIVWCGSYECSRAHEKRFNRAMV